MNKHWYLIGHLAGARIFEQEGIKQELRLVRRFENPEGKLKTSELVSDRQGRSDSNSMIGHNAVGNVDTARKHVLENFVQEIGKFLEQQAERNAFASIVLVAEPHVLGEIKKVIRKVTSHRMRQAVTKDLVHVSDHDMATQLKGVLCQHEEIRA
jgi:protein required for attachment to host cells